MKPITYISDQGADYCAALTKCETLPQLRAILEEYRTIFPDALDAAPANQEEFDAWRTGLRKERRGKFAGEDFMKRFGAVLLPELMVKVGCTAAQFGAPWGCAFLRLRDVGRIKYQGDIARWQDPANYKSVSK